MPALGKFTAFIVVLFFANAAVSQNCALCYTQAASSGAQLIAALRNGILVLIVPPMLMSIGITWLAYRKRNQFREDTNSGDFESFDE
jgi:hypothetical protein